MKIDKHTPERAAVRATIRYLKKGWGGNCKTKDYEDHKDLFHCKTPKDYEYWIDARCQSCRAAETIDFLKQHLKYL